MIEGLVQQEVLEPGRAAKPPNPWATPPCSLQDMTLRRAMIRPSTKVVSFLLLLLLSFWQHVTLTTDVSG